MSDWVLPDYVADILPFEAFYIEKLRRKMLNKSFNYGYELVIPPLFEHLESLLAGKGKSLDLQTFKLVDQVSGKMLGLRADMTQQVARIDAHLLNRQGIVRLCYCGSILHTWPDNPHSSREPLQLGAEIYGYAGLEADLEIVELSLDCLSVTNFSNFTVDFADVGIVNCILESAQVNDQKKIHDIYSALAVKDSSELNFLTRKFPAEAREALVALPQMYGDISVLTEATKVLHKMPATFVFLSKLQWIAEHIKEAQVSFDLADLRGYNYYSGMRFAIYSNEVKDALVRGGRYNRVGVAYGRDRPAAGFSLDLKQVVNTRPADGSRSAIHSCWANSKDLDDLVKMLRSQGETVIFSVSKNHEVDGVFFDREIVFTNGHWIIQAL